MPDIVCPECGRTSHLVAIRRSAEEFCAHCDFPLFWAPSNIPAMVPGTSSEASRRRLPGAGGRLKVGSRDCWSCGELNSIADTHCHRCGVDLDPVEEEVEEVVIPDLPPPPVPEIDQPPWWRWLILGAGMAAVIGIVAALAWI